MNTLYIMTDAFRICVVLKYINNNIRQALQMDPMFKN